MVNIAQTMSQEIAEVVAQVRPSIVQISGKRGSIGAGTVWHADGLIITNAHVVHDEQPRVVLADGRAFEGRILALDRENDIAALSIDAHDLPTVRIGDSQQVRAGHWVIGLGHPYGVQDTATAGVVIGQGVDLPEVSTGREWIALSLRLRPGHSGGPLVNVAGEMVGINTMISGPEVGFAVPTHTVKAFLKQNGIVAEAVPASD
jgi:serine protease Do